MQPETVGSDTPFSARQRNRQFLKRDGCWYRRHVSGRYFPTTISGTPHPYRSVAELVRVNRLRFSLVRGARAPQVMDGLLRTSASRGTSNAGVNGK